MSNNIPKPPKVVVAPEGCSSYFTAGKEYLVISIWDSSNNKFGYGFTLNNDSGYKVDCIENKCAHLNYGNWIVKEREQ